VQALQCLDGHVVCSTCRDQLTECPQCRAPFSKNSVARNRRLEEIIEKLNSLSM
jgi:predicted amidophosphoribosyltransferase